MLLSVSTTMFQSLEARTQRTKGLTGRRVGAYLVCLLSLNSPEFIHLLCILTSAFLSLENVDTLTHI